MADRYLPGLPAGPFATGPWLPAGVYDPRAFPGYEAALRGIFVFATERQEKGSRWFGPSGLLGPARGSLSVAQSVSFVAAFENTQNTDQDSGAAAVPPQPLYNHNPASSAFPTRNEDNAIALAADNQDVGPAAFFPMQMRRVMNGQLLDAPRAPRHEYEAAGVSYNYRGDISNPKNLSADIPNDCNCSFWVRRLPPSTTVTSLLAAIRGTGRVYCTVITPPNPLRGFNTAAAKVVFFELAAARRFWDTYGSGGRFRIPFVVVGGRPAIVERNRTKVAESDLPRHVSRVVLVSGAEELLNVDEMLAEFAAKFSFEIDDIFVTTEYRPSADGPQQVCTIEFRFGSFRCQAQSAYHMISGRPGLSVRYGRDPCDQ